MELHSRTAWACASIVANEPYSYQIEPRGYL